MRVILLVASFGLTANAAPVPKAKTKTVEEKVIGTWKLVPEKGKNPGYTLFVEYKTNGVMVFRTVYDQNLLPTEEYTGTYTVVEPDEVNKFGTIDWSIKDADGRRSETARISKLTDDELTEVDPKGVVEHFERVKPEKKGK